MEYRPLASCGGDAETAAYRAKECSFREHPTSIAFPIRIGGQAMRHLSSRQLRRRSLLKGGVATGFAAAALLPSGGFAQAKTQTINLQLGWLAGNNQLGEVSAKNLGYFEEEKLNGLIQPGGPSIDGEDILASSRLDIIQDTAIPS